MYVCVYVCVVSSDANLHFLLVYSVYVYIYMCTCIHVYVATLLRLPTVVQQYECNSRKDNLHIHIRTCACKHDAARSNVCITTVCERIATGPLCRRKEVDVWMLLSGCTFSELACKHARTLVGTWFHCLWFGVSTNYVLLDEGKKTFHERRCWLYKLSNACVLLRRNWWSLLTLRSITESYLEITCPYMYCCRGSL